MTSLNGLAGFVVAFDISLVLHGLNARSLPLLLLHMPYWVAKFQNRENNFKLALSYVPILSLNLVILYKPS
ncbi:uncharacterized protein GGS22DRAFT_74276 [Annulohypoxylon maeteangense]|uniref:uncharacterized protein n=1 Tax=Annulohypoxylon maeteangense TaxID=1927788 RepID=UPI0020084F77|nr:uncharacterized protein GGS22DRAFT_74276 [Annulohypoxylon maeteangense]KAI0881381.1 hypothetical protein GGS22DRAFT_74276 [Annulohypoxylon maeteangense]